MIPVLPHDAASGSGSGSGDRLAWLVALDRLELDLIKVERATDPADAPVLDQWDRPDLHGTVPADLVDRARDLQRRQTEAIARLQGSLAAVQRQREVTDRIAAPTGRGPVSPAYVDTSA